MDSPKLAKETDESLLVGKFSVQVGVGNVGGGDDGNVVKK